MKTKPELDYAIVVEQLAEADGGGWLASVPALPGCYGDGETRTAALEDALAAIEEWKDAAHQLGREVLAPRRPANGDSACHERCMTSYAGWPRPRA